VAIPEVEGEVIWQDTAFDEVTSTVNVSVGAERIRELTPFAKTLTETPAANAGIGKFTNETQTNVYMVKSLAMNLWEMAFDMKIFSHYIP